MKLIVGLGNPGKDYQDTRHNAGWLVLDALATKLGVGEWQTKKDLEVDLIEILVPPPPRQGGEIPAQGKLLLAKPITFMNNSGRAVESVRAYYKLETADIIVVHDELDLPLGTIRTRFGGTSAGHNGVGSLIHHLGTEEFWRVRIGIGPGDASEQHPEGVVILPAGRQAPTRPGVTPRTDATDYVLDRFSHEERAVLDRVVDETASRLVDWLSSGAIPETSFTIPFT